MSIIMRLLPNVGERAGAPTTVMLSETQDDVDEVLTRWEDGAGAHYIVDGLGAIWQLVENEDVVLNAPDSSIAVMLTDTKNNDPYTDAQIGSLIALVTALCHEYKIPLNKVLGDSKTEGPFPWFDFLNVVGARVSELQLKCEDFKT